MLRKMFFSFVLLLMVAINLLFSPCVGTTAEIQVIKIGILGYLSGPALAWGLAQQQSGRIFVNEINEQGGILVGGKRYKFEIVAYDDKNPSGAVSAIRKMIFDDGIKHTFGPLMSSGWVAVQSVTTPNKILNFGSGYTKIPRGPEK